MSDATTSDVLSGTGGRMRVPRSRGVVSGLALVVLGLWGGLVPFIGPYFDFAFTPHPNTAWHWTAARGWYEVLPGGVAVLGGLLLLFSANRAMTSLGAWLGVAAGGWFTIAPILAPLLTLGTLGTSANGHRREMALEYLTYFVGLGAVIVLFAALAAGRLSVHSVRDVKAAARREAEQQQAEQQQAEQERLRAEQAAEHRAPADETAPMTEPAQQAAPEPEPSEQVAPEPEPSEQAAPEPESERSSAADVPSEAARQKDGRGYATPQRYVRSGSPEQIPVEQIQRDHPVT